MAMRPLLLAAVVGIAAAGAFQPAAAQSRGYVSISVGTPAPYYRNQYHHPGYAWVPGHWVATYRGRVWVPAQYVRVHGYGYGHGRDHGYGGYGGYGDGYRGYGYGDGYGGYGYGGHGGARVIYRSGLNHRVVPRPYYPPGYLSPYDHRRRPDW
jgi:hypothetical protein